MIGRDISEYKPILQQALAQKQQISARSNFKTTKYCFLLFPFCLTDLQITLF